MNEIATDRAGQGLAIGIVRARFNERVGAAMQNACLARLAELGHKPEDIDVIVTPHGHPDHIGGLVEGRKLILGGVEALKK